MPSTRGGQDNEIGSEYRARLGAMLASSILLADDLGNVGAPVAGIPRSIAAEADAPVDDLVVRLTDDSQVHVQAKHRVGLSESPTTPFGKAIRQFVVAHQEQIGQRGPLVLAFAKGSEPLNELATWLAKNRFSEQGVPSRKELQAAAALRALLERLGLTDEAQQRLLLRRIFLWRTDPRDGDAKAVIIQRLRQAGVPVQELANAYDDLAQRMRVLAQHRAGDSLEDLAGWLQSRGRLKLQPGQPDRLRGALLLDDYRARTIQTGRTLSAYGVPAVVAQIPLSDGDAVVRVQLPQRHDEHVPRERSLHVAIRRRRRVLLVGAGGSGKSTALRVLAADFAGDPRTSPLPLSAHVRDLLDHGDDPLTASIANATRQLSAEDAVALGEAIRAAFSRGETALLLDGFDEVSGRERIAAALQTWLNTAPETTEVVLATRPTVLKSAAALGWTQLRLAEPRQPGATAEAIVSAVAEDASRDESWATERLEWVHERLRRDEGLSETPLMVVLLATLAALAEREGELPQSRPEVLWAVLSAVTNDWEVGTRHGGNVTVGQLTRSEVAQALRIGLVVLSRVALGPREVDWRVEMANELAAQFGEIAPARLRAYVDDTAEFWFATGIFSATESGIRAHPRSLAEATMAQEVIESDSWKTQAERFRSDPSGWAVLQMIVARQSDARAWWAKQVAEGGNADELVALTDAHLDGATLAPEDVERICVSPAIARTLANDHEPDRVVEALLALTPSAPRLEALHRTVTVALPIADHDALRASLLVRLPKVADTDRLWLKAYYGRPRPKSGMGDDGAYRVDTLDNASLRAMRDVAIWLAQQSREEAEFAVRHLAGLLRPNFLSRLAKTLRDLGYLDLANRVQGLPLDYELDSALGGQFAGGIRLALQVAAEAGRPRSLPWTEQRRMDELADLWASMETRWWHPAWIQNRRETLTRYQRLAIMLGGFDASTVAAEAQDLLGRIDRDPDAHDLLTDDASARSLTRWELIDDPESVVEEIVNIFRLVQHECVGPLTVALAHAPCRAFAFETLTAVQPAFRGPWSGEAARAALALSDDLPALVTSWSTHHDVRHREATTSAVGYLLVREREPAHRLTRVLLDDPDRGVQVAMMREVARAVDDGLALSPGLLQRLLAVERSPLKRYECPWCCADVKAGAKACAECRTSAPELGAAAKRSLGFEVHTVSSDALHELLRARAPSNRIRRPSVLE